MVKKAPHRAVALMSLILSLASGCASAPKAGSQAAAGSKGDSPQVQFLFGTERFAGQLTAGVEVTAVAGDGRLVPLGETGQNGLRIDKEVLKKLEAVVLLFCHKGFHCGAVRLGPRSIGDFDEVFVDLAQVVIY